MQFVTSLITTLLFGLTVAAPTQPELSGLVERASEPPVHWYYSCQLQGDFRRVDRTRAIQGVDIFEKKRDQSLLLCAGAGPGTCVDFGHNAGWNQAELGFCNDNPYPKCVLNSDLTARAQTLLTDMAFSCAATADNQNGAGQGFYNDGTNIIIQHAKELA